MLQLSTVCRKLAQAAVRVPALRKGISVGIRHTNGIIKPDRLDSPLLLSWAAHAEALALYQDAHNTPGLAQLLAAAVNITLLCTESEDVLAAAQVDHLISKCRPVTSLQLAGPCPPSVLPEAVEELLVGWELQGCLDFDFDPRQVDILLYHCTRLPHLRRLSLDFGLLQPVTLTCAAQLGKLDSLGIELNLCDAEISLSWVLAQPCEHREFWVDVITRDEGRHAAFVQQLSQIRLQMLTVTLQSDFTAALQALWACVQAERLTIKFYAGSTQGSHALNMLPCCSTVVLELSQSWDLPAAVQISWEALTRHASKVIICLDVPTELHVTGFEQNGTLLDDMQQPWQLVVSGGGGVQGLPAS